MRVFILIVIFLFVFMGCSQGPQQGIEDITSGRGLEADFTLNTRFLPIVEYELKLKNSGRNAVELTPENFRIRTNPVFSGRSVFQEEDLLQMTQTIFERGPIILPTGQERVIRGTLQVRDDFYQDLSQESFEVIVSLSYDYETVFSNNLNLNFNNFQIRTDRLSQAAPVILDDIDLLAESRESFFLLYHIRDRNRGQQRITFDNYEIILGTNVLSCTSFSVSSTGTRTERTLSNLFIDSTSPQILFSCRVPSSLVEQQQLNTITSGRFSYAYTLEFRRTVQLPRDRSLITGR